MAPFRAQVAANSSSSAAPIVEVLTFAVSILDFFELP